MINQELVKIIKKDAEVRRQLALERIRQGEPLKAPLRKEDQELGYACCCPDCKRAVCVSGTCKCGTEICFDLPHVHYSGRIRWE